MKTSSGKLVIWGDLEIVYCGNWDTLLENVEVL